MAGLTATAERFGWLGAAILFAVYEIATKWIPRWQQDSAQSRAQAAKEEEAERAALVNVYERFIAQNERTIGFIHEMTQVVQMVSRQLEANTIALVAVERRLEGVERREVPMADCPLQNMEKAQ